jgi:gamma-glutamylcysteine synthetase
VIEVTDKIEILVNQFTKKYIDVLSGLKSHGIRSYGFEYEFLPLRVLTIQDKQSVCRLLPEIGFISDGDEYQSANGLRVSFEPGGQIEYCSPPLLKDDHLKFSSLLSMIHATNTEIKKRLNIEYVGTDYIPGRAGAPLCLTSDRYIKMHNRLGEINTRGLEMMKGTASIHLHVLISCFDEVLPLFNRLCSISSFDEFKMSAQRRDIWNHTDSSRCGCPPCCFEQLASSSVLIQRLIRFALKADVIGENITFVDSADLSFNAFLYHMTTLFTDVRFNLKGPTLELRTMDSMPLDSFRIRWKKFIGLFENI